MPSIKDHPGGVGAGTPWATRGAVFTRHGGALHSPLPRPDQLQSERKAFPNQKTHREKTGDNRGAIGNECEVNLVKHTECVADAKGVGEVLHFLPWLGDACVSLSTDEHPHHRSHTSRPEI